MTKEIRLNHGLTTLVDDDDYERICQFKWHAHLACEHWYATSKDKGKQLKLHRFILGVSDSSFVVDHINGDTLDNRKANLRICTQKDNARNRRIDKDNRLGFKGVTMAGNHYRARIRVDNKLIQLGCHLSPIEAAKAYDAAAKKYYGEFARTNFNEEA